MRIGNKILRDIGGWIQMPLLFVQVKGWSVDRLIMVHNSLLSISKEYPDRLKESSFRAFRRIVLKRIVSLSIDMYRKRTPWRLGKTQN